jgi:hypothetical protein
MANPFPPAGDPLGVLRQARRQAQWTKAKRPGGTSIFHDIGHVASSGYSALMSDRTYRSWKRQAQQKGIPTSKQEAWVRAHMRGAK